MSEKILFNWKCKMCGEVWQTITRAKNVNPSLTYIDAWNMASRKVGELKLDTCPHCDEDTVNEFVGISKEQER